MLAASTEQDNTGLSPEDKAKMAISMEMEGLLSSARGIAIYLDRIAVAKAIALAEVLNESHKVN